MTRPRVPIAGPRAGVRNSRKGVWRLASRHAPAVQRLGAELKVTGRIASIVRRRKFKPGTRLIREWQGRTHEVTVLQDGFRWNDETYRSLSAIARAITGTRW